MRPLFLFFFILLSINKIFAIEDLCQDLQLELDHTSLTMLGLKHDRKGNTLGDYYHQLVGFHEQKQFYANLLEFVQGHNISNEVKIEDWVAEYGYKHIELINPSCDIFLKEDLKQVEVDNCNKHLVTFQIKPKKFNSAMGEINKQINLVEQKIKKIVTSPEHEALEKKFQEQSTLYMQKCPKQMKQVQSFEKETEVVCTPTQNNSNINVFHQLNQDVTAALITEEVSQKKVAKDKNKNINKEQEKVEKCPAYAHRNPDTNVCEEDKELLKVYQQNKINNKRAWGNVAKVTAVVAGVGGVSLLTAWGMKSIFDKEKNKSIYTPYHQYNASYQYQQMQYSPPMLYPPYHFNYFNYNNPYGSQTGYGVGGASQMHNPYDFQFSF
jgi:hypothetical protein